MRKLAMEALDRAMGQGARYADVRVIESRQETVSLKNGAGEELRQSADWGYGVRVLVAGAWGFAGSSQAEELDQTVKRAIELAKASAPLRRQGVELAPVEAFHEHHISPAHENPLQISLEEKLALLAEVDQELRREPQIKVAECSLQAAFEDKYFASTQGSRLRQTLTTVGASAEALAVTGHTFQRRSYQNRAQAGFEFIRQLHLSSRAAQLASEAVALLSAQRCPQGVTDVVLGSNMVALQVHESCGHPAELDRALGSEISFAGGSFLTPEQLGRLRYGSELVNLTADATLRGGMGSSRYDDEGVPAQRVPLVQAGRFVGYLTSRETAPLVGLAPSGAMRAAGWGRTPLIRMTNINLEPGDATLSDLIAGVDQGIFMDTPRSWSLDDLRLNFHFSCELAFEIKQGKLGRVLRDAAYTGLTPRFWGSCDGIAGPADWLLWGFPNCAKGEPMQLMAVGHGGAPARFRQVQVGAA
ncbi:MAG: TldD/PmbA family protein [Deinococcus sp.]|nr:TldD/PmbA family protein [Deinococcus sp.]